MNTQDLNKLIGMTMRRIQLSKDGLVRDYLRAAVNRLNAARRALRNGWDNLAGRCVANALEWVRMARLSASNAN